MKPEDAVSACNSPEGTSGSGAVAAEGAPSGVRCQQNGLSRRLRQYHGGFTYVIGGRMECVVDGSGRTTYRFLK